MWLINTQTLKLHEIIDPEDAGVRYAILSHTWGTPQEEVSISDFADLNQARKKAGFAKIEKTCEIAKSEGLEYAWVDTCCIDKSSSAELSEAINSMFMWYRLAEVCYIYLQDLKEGANDFKTWPDLEQEENMRRGSPVLQEMAHQDCLDSNFARCRWFSRGWTLQELIAPRKAVFYNARWCQITSKHDIAPVLGLITGIHKDILVGKAAIGDVPILKRMAWAAKRTTTRVEDTAYCLLGIFDINIPLIYGEGSKAFRRLQEAIIRKTDDVSILAWSGQNPPAARYRPRAFRDWEPNLLEYRGALAWAPCEFIFSRKSMPLRLHERDPAQAAMAIHPTASLELRSAQSITMNNAIVVHMTPEYSDTHLISSEALELSGSYGCIYRRLRRCLTGHVLEGPAFRRDDIYLLDFLSHGTDSKSRQDDNEYRPSFNILPSLTLLDQLSPQQTADLKKPVTEISISWRWDNQSRDVASGQSDPLWPLSRWSDVTSCFAVDHGEPFNDSKIRLVALQHLRTHLRNPDNTFPYFTESMHNCDFIVAIGSICRNSEDTSALEHHFRPAIMTRRAEHISSDMCNDNFDWILGNVRTRKLLHWTIHEYLADWLQDEVEHVEDQSLFVKRPDGSRLKVVPKVHVWQQNDDLGHSRHCFDLELISSIVP